MLCISSRLTGYIKHADGWLEWGTNQYYINDRPVAMEDARSYCRQRHGDLVVINSEAENIFLWKMVRSVLKSSSSRIFVDTDNNHFLIK